MESWFLFALLSVFFGGFQVFGFKVAAERKYDISLTHIASAPATCLLLGAVMFFQNRDVTMSLSVFFWILLSGFIFMCVNVTRHEALQCIDTAIYYPIYKAIGPTLVICGGFLFFAERFTTTEIVGLLLSVLVPLLLITNIEKFRQKIFTEA